MKILHLIIILGSVIILSISSNLIIFADSQSPWIVSKNFTQDLANHGYAIIPSNTTEWFLWWNHYNYISNYSDIIFTGNITSKNISNITSFYTVGHIISSRSFLEGTEYITGPPYNKINYTLNLDQYTVNVDEFLKNPQTSNKIMVIREPITDPTWHSDPDGPRFNVGDHVLFYVKNLDGANVYSQASFKIPKTCNAKEVLTQNPFAGSDFSMAQNGVQIDYNKSVENINHFTANKPIQFIYSLTADTLSGKDSVIKYEISKDPSNEIVSSSEINANSKNCEWMESTEWELSLKDGNYYANIYVKNDDGTFRQTYSVGFSVKPNETNTSLPSSNSSSEEIPTSKKGPDPLTIVAVIDSPLKQFKSGIDAKSVICKEGLQLVIKSENGSPTCVTPQTKIKLVDLGWAVDDSVRTRGVAPFDTLRANVYGTIFSINYTISGGQLENATADVQNRSLIILIKTIENGALIVDLPRALIDPQINGQESQFIIIEDGKEVEYRQIDTTDKDRILTIPFQYGVSKIEIISPEPIR